jgi:hypothetical protein
MSNKIQITTDMAIGNNKVEISLPDGTNLNFLFYYNDLSKKIGFNLNYNEIYIFNGINMTLTKNMLSPLDFLGKLYIHGSFPTLSTIDKTSILFFEGN